MQARNIATALAAILLVILLLFVVAGAAMLGMMGGGMMGSGMMGGSMMGGLPGEPGCCGFAPVGGIVLISVGSLIAVGLIALVVWPARRPNSERPSPANTRALDILRERYARGELSREQYTQMRSDI